MGLGKMFTRNIQYDVSNSQTGEKASYTIITDGGPGMYPGWGYGDYRGGMSIPVAWRLSLLIANQLGRIPWHSYREVAGRPPVKIVPTPAFLAAPVGAMDTRLGAFRSWTLDRLWHGNGIGIVAARSPLGWPTAATPVSAEFVQNKLVTSQDSQPGFAVGEIAYLINGRWYHQRDVIHFKGPCKPGDLRGMGILEEHFDAMDRSRKLDASAGAVDSSAVPTGVLKSLNPDLSKTEAQELKDGWRESQRTRTVAVLNPLTEFTPIAWNPEESQLLEARKYTLVEWANIFGVDPSWAGGESASGDYANIETKGFNLLKFDSVGDIIAEFEETLTALQPRGTYVKANVDHLLRADTKTRYEAHAIAISSGFRTRDEVRELEELPPLTPEQKAEIAAMDAPAPPANNTQGAGAARPRPSTSGLERGRHSFNPNQPRDPDGQWSDGGSSAAYRRAPRRTSAAWDDDVERIAAIPQPADRDDQLAEILAVQGFDGVPQVVGSAEFDALPDDHQRLYRGIAGAQAPRWAEDFRSGTLFPGLGAYGNGTYTSTDQQEAGGYARGSGWRGATEDGVVVRMAVTPQARRITLERLRVDTNDDERMESGASGRALGDYGRRAAALGYDVLDLPPLPGDEHNFSVVLNRTALIVEKP